MLLQSFMTSENGRLRKWVIKAQKERQIDYGWYAETQKIGGEHDEKRMKKQVKENIEQHVEQRSKKKETSMKKLRHQKGDQFSRKEYLKRIGLTMSREVLKRRLYK